MSGCVKLRRMTAEDWAFADSLRATVGWNQTLRDWQRLLALAPEGCFVAELDGRPVGTATTICYSSDLAWIGMVLVHPAFRRHGVGRALLEHCIAHLQSQHIRCIKLDATPLGKTLYDQLGFRDEGTLARWEKFQVPSCQFSAHASVVLKTFSLSDAVRLFALDEKAFGISRQQLLERLLHQSQAVFVAGKSNVLSGYGLMRAGSRANYIGPVVARDVDSGRALVERLLAETRRGMVYWDIPDWAADAVALAKELGFVQQRALVRMYLGENKSPGWPETQWAIADPATG